MPPAGKDPALTLGQALGLLVAVRVQIVPSIMAVINVAIVTAALLLLDRKVAVTLIPITYLIPVIIAATRSGLWPATIASLAGTAVSDVFFPPLHSLQFQTPQDVIYLLLFLVVSLVISDLASRLKRETDTLRQREKEMQRLHEFSRSLAACCTVNDLLAAIRAYLSRNLGPRSTFFVASADSHFEPPETETAPRVVLECVASMAATADAVGHVVVDPSNQDVWLLRAVCSGTHLHGVIAINIGPSRNEDTKAKAQGLEAALDEVSLTLQRLDVRNAIEEARSHQQAELLRDAFHGALSHELCSPLATIRGSASVLASVPIVRGHMQVRSLVDAISDEVTQLESHIQNLLLATRLTTGGLEPRLEWTDPRDIINAAIKRTARRLQAHEVVSAFDEELPLIKVDSSLLEEACGQLLQNAAKYSHSGSAIEIGVHADRGRVTLTVSDQGVGIGPDELHELGRRSFRSERHRAHVPGFGLGFWIASTFVKANGGIITVSSRGHGMGTTVSIALPVSQSTTPELTPPDNE